MNAASTSIRRSAWRAAAAVALVLCAAGAARAQDIEPMPLRTWSLKAGAFLPTNGHLIDQAGDPWWYFGVDYRPHLGVRPLNADVHVGVDFAFRDTAGRGFFSIPVLGKLVWTLTPVGSHYRLYAGVGGGIYFVNTAFMGGATEPGLQAIVGLDLTDRFFVEASYDWVGGFSDNLGFGLRVDGLKAAAGVRF